MENKENVILHMFRCVLCLTSETRAFSFFCSVHRPAEISISVVVPSWEPQPRKRPLSCTRMLYRASSQTCEKNTHTLWHCQYFLKYITLRYGTVRWFRYKEETLSTNFEAESRVVLFKQHVPHVQGAVHLYCKENRGSDWTPAAI